MKHALFIIAFKEFRDEEYFIPRNILESNGIKTSTASCQKGLAVGVNGGDVKVNMDLDEVDVSKYNAIVFVGGMGALKDLNNERSYRIIKDAINENLVISAICIAPVIFARSGMFKNRKSTVWTSNMDKSAKKILEEEQMIYVDEKVVIDRDLITADGPESAKEFSKAILDNI